NVHPRRANKQRGVLVPRVAHDQWVGRHNPPAGKQYAKGWWDSAELVPARRVRYTAEKPVNVASVPQRSTFRYPGGKTWLVPYIRDWLKSNKSPPARLIEPFAGGAIVSLTAAFERLARHVIFAEMDEGVAAVWRVVLNGQAEWLAKQILNFEVTLESVTTLLHREASDLRDTAFQTILRNRVQRGGILAAGAGLVKTGENGRGLLSRWYPETLSRRLRKINRQKDKLTFVEGDGFALIEEHKADAEAVFYIDPPYTLAARRLCLILLPRKGLDLPRSCFFLAASIIRLERWRFSYGRKLTPSRICSFKMQRMPAVESWVDSQLAHWDKVVSTSLDGYDAS
ncbi:MAG: DNA adenine methylase, partial [Verrucomicrobiota bacterium]